MRRFIPIIALLVPISGFAVVNNQLIVTNALRAPINEVDFYGCDKPYSKNAFPLVAARVFDKAVSIKSTLNNCKSMKFYQYANDNTKRIFLASCSFPAPTNFGANGTSPVCVSVNTNSKNGCAVNSCN